jgi:hypothetical protein
MINFTYLKIIKYADVIIPALMGFVTFMVISGAKNNPRRSRGFQNRTTL